MQGSNIKIVEWFKYVGVYMNNKVDSSSNTTAINKKG